MPSVAASGIRQNSSREFSIFINDSGLQEIDLYETSKRTALIE